MPVTDFVRIATSGPTVDGRTIQSDWLTEAASNYDPDNVYAARINAEHISGLRPDGDYPAYGQIVELKTEEVTVTVDGEDRKETGLFARLDVNDKAVELNQKDQKVFSSIEVAPDFAGHGVAYVVGMALTDTPASLGCERLTFSKGKNEPSNVASKAAELELKFAEEETDSDDVKGLTSAITSGIEKLTKVLTGKPEEQPEVKPETTPDEPEGDDAKFAAIATGLTQLGTSIDSFAKNVDDRLKASDAKVAELTKTIEETPKGQFQRSLANGGGASGKDHPGY